MVVHMNFSATTAFGLEAVVKREVTRLGFSGVSALDGRVNFSGDFRTMAKANLWLRSADRVLLVMGSFKALTFDELFEGVKALPWGELVPEDGKFTVIGKSVKSVLHSVPACQSIVKKAIADSLMAWHKVSVLPETGPEYKIQISLLKDQAELTIDTSGNGLHKRGYRMNAMEAPLKETLAAALISLTYWRPGRILFDPVCGSGTIPIEAALMASNTAPGLFRSFTCEAWPQTDKKAFEEERALARSKKVDVEEVLIFGSDKDPEAIALARENAAKAGVAKMVQFETKLLASASLPGPRGIAVLNPPYAMRLGTPSETERLIKDMASLIKQDDSWSLNVLTADEFFEKAYGKKAQSKRKLFNGNIKADFYMYPGV
jgi:putative N6-adenine-specific DNA methylase